jgi:hypothetical protein
MLENYVRKNERTFRKALQNEASYLASSNRKKGRMLSVVRNVIMVSRYFDTDTKAIKALNVPTKGGRVGMGANKQ